MNLFKQFENLLPKRPLEIGVITVVEGGSVLIELPSGQTMRARGTGTLGDVVFVRDGALEGAAPDLPEDTVDV
ncbi:hypothetical protein [Ottowia sp.]|uniref:hypothetical protein n=1 Tax=Ottowia sp. TaxID=1898956 RepID=UPI003A8C569A